MIFAIHSHESATGVHVIPSYSLLIWTCSWGPSAIPAFWFLQKNKKQCCHEPHCIWVSVHFWRVVEHVQLWWCCPIVFQGSCTIFHSRLPVPAPLHPRWEFSGIFPLPFGHCVGGVTIFSLLGSGVFSRFLVGLNFMNLQRTSVASLDPFNSIFLFHCFLLLPAFFISLGWIYTPDFPLRDSWY